MAKYQGIGASTGQYQRKGGKSRGGVRKGGKSRGGVGKGGKSRGGVEWNLLERENVHVLKNDVVCEKVCAYVRT